MQIIKLLFQRPLTLIVFLNYYIQLKKEQLMIKTSISKQFLSQYKQSGTRYTVKLLAETYTQQAIN